MKRAATSGETEQARIYLGDQRGCTQTQQHRNFHTFNFGSYMAESRGAFHILQTLNDETLAPGETVSYRTQTDGLVAMIPLVGACRCRMGAKDYMPDAGQVLVAPIRQGDTLAFQNPYADEHINYLTLEIRGTTTLQAALTDVDLGNQYNTLHHVEVSAACEILLGVFLGREEVSLPFPAPGKDTFVFVLEGAFEVNNRLLHRRDGLALPLCAQLECEALSNHAMILAITLG
jgi:quercetin 2,3-dioxygenase